VQRSEQSTQPRLPQIIGESTRIIHGLGPEKLKTSLHSKFTSFHGRKPTDTGKKARHAIVLAVMESRATVRTTKKVRASLGRGRGKDRKYHTNATTGHVGSNHDWGFSCLELIQNPITLVLLFVSVNCKTGPSILTEEPCNLVCSSFCSSEDKTFTEFIVHNLLKVFDKAITLRFVSFNTRNIVQISNITYLIVIVHDLNDLLNVVVGREIQGTNINLNEIVQEVRGELSNFLRPSGRPHASLSVRPNLTNYFTDLWLYNKVSITYS